MGFILSLCLSLCLSSPLLTCPFPRRGVVTGKSGKTYWLNLDDLGGYQNGPNKLDDVIQVYQNENSVYAGAGVYPLEGGYIYINVIQYPTHVFKFSCNNGVPSFNHVADSPEKNAYILGVGHGTVTSLNDQPGTGLVWTSDVEGSNLRIYNAIPDPTTNLLVEINSFVLPGVTKFTRPVFGDGIVFQGTTIGVIYALGAPVNLPMNCTSLQFGTININSTSTPKNVQCQANIAITITAEALSGNPNFILSGFSVFPLQIAQGQNFSFQAVFSPSIVGPLSSSVILNTTQQVQGYSTNTPIQLQGTGQSQAALLSVSPVTVAWNGVITGQQAGGVNQSVIFTNLGNNAVSISSTQYSLVSETGPWLNASQLHSNGTGVAISAFTFIGLPSTIAPNSAVTIPINFNPSISGNYAVYVQVNSNGGSRVFDVVATGADYPVAVLEFQTTDGNSWIPYASNKSFTFGNVTEGTTRYLKMRLSNNGSVNAAALSVTVSKPPFGVAGLIGANNQVDLAEGTLVYAGQSLTATLYCSAPKSQIDVDPYNGTAQWTMNLDDPNFGKQFIQFFCNAVSEQAAPLNPVTQQAIYRYGGCYTENNPGRQLQNNIYSGSNNTNEICISQCAAAGYIFAGTEYTQQCWCGFNRPKKVNPDANCNFACTGNVNEICGGNGVNGGSAFISVFGDITRWDGNRTNAPGPYVNPGTVGYSSIGCYTEGTNTRALSVQPNANNTVASCLKACQGYLYSGVEYGGECFCGNSLAIGAVPASTSDCSMTCNNNQTELCGGPSRLNMYIYGNGTLPSPTSSPSSSSPIGNNNAQSTAGPSIPANIGLFSYNSCFTEATDGRALTAFALADNSVTLQTCAGNCTQYKYFGVEYSRECYCGNSLSAASVIATDGRCSMTCSGNSSEICGGPNGLTLYSQGNFSVSATNSISTLAASPTPLPTVIQNCGMFFYQACYSEVQGRALQGKAVASNDMTVRYCAGNCSSFAYMAVEYGAECYCGNTLVSGSAPVTDGRCNMPCAGNAGTICGGPNGLTLYQYQATNVTSTSPLATSTASLSTVTSQANLTTLTSIATASSSNSIFSTLTNSIVTVQPTGPMFTSSVLGNTTRSGNSTSKALNFASATGNSSFLLPNTTSQASSSVLTNATSISLTNFITPPAVVSTTTSHLNFTSVSFNFSSMQVSSTSRPNATITAFFSTLTNASITSVSLNSTIKIAVQANSTSVGSSKSTSYSGTNFITSGGFLTAANATSRSSSSSVSTSNANATTLATSTSKASSSNLTSSLSTSSPTSTSNPWTYLGCANETSPRALSGASTASSNMTIPLCQAFCLSQAPPLPLAGLEYARECYCGTSLQNNSTLDQSGCGISCVGNGSQICGGSDRLSVYNYTAYIPPSVVRSVGNYSYAGCYTDASPRVLGRYAFSAANMTVEACVAGCQAKGYSKAGAEYSTQCFCDVVIASGGSLVGDNQCNMVCGGNDREYCGGSSRLSVYSM
jgi:hypothetical protein